MTNSSEAGGNTPTIADVVYQADPSHRITVRVRAIVDNATLEPVRSASPQSFRFDGSIDFEENQGFGNGCGDVRRYKGRDVDTSIRRLC